MNAEEYAAAVAEIANEIVQMVLEFGKFFTRQALTRRDWYTLLTLLFPQIRDRRYDVARLAREFYDSQRLDNGFPATPRHLETYDFERFVAAMEPARVKMSQEDSPVDAATTLALRAVREVENAGRQQIIHAVQENAQADNPTGGRLLRGWARVATGAETCAWCLMLVSRGPVYLDASTAGLDLDSDHALHMWHSKESIDQYSMDIDDLMEQWHDGCDCKVVPVFKNEGWFGQEAEHRALELWKEATREAKRLRRDGASIHTHGKDKGEELTFNQEALNALRRKLSRGEINPYDYAALAA